MENIRHEGINGYLVSHGSSLVPQYIVNEINALGGKVSGHGIPMEQLKIVIPCGISKINMDTDIRLATTRNVLEYFASHKDKQNSEIYKLMKAKPESFDYRYYLSPIMNELLGIKKECEEAEVMEDLLKKAVKEIVLTASVSFGDVGDAKYISNISLDEMKKEYQK
jgi:fructose-bisphosphate aldolase, class II